MDAQEDMPMDDDNGAWAYQLELEEMRLKEEVENEGYNKNKRFIAKNRLAIWDI